MFIPYTCMPVFAYKGNGDKRAEIVNVFKNAKLKWVDDESLSIFCLSYNQIRPMNDVDILDSEFLTTKGI